MPLQPSRELHSGLFILENVFSCKLILTRYDDSMRLTVNSQTVSVGVLSPPVLCDGFGCLIQPARVGQQSDQFDGAKEFHGIRSRLAQWSQFPRTDQDGDIFRCAVQELRHLTRQETGRQIFRRPSRQCRLSHLVVHTPPHRIARHVVEGIPRSPGTFELAIALRHILHFHFVRIRRLILSRIRAVGVSATCPCRIVSES